MTYDPERPSTIDKRLMRGFEDGSYPRVDGVPPAPGIKGLGLEADENHSRFGETKPETPATSGLPPEVGVTHFTDLDPRSKDQQ